jgi:arabinan endo-1,5-alpha-L-arabinosidase
VALVAADLAWEGGLVEAPTMTRVGDRWLLLYSANRWETEDYTMGAAWCDAPTGPCGKQAEPVLATRSGIEGPGGVEFASGVRAGTQLVTFHAWPEGQVGDASARRLLQVGRARYDPTTDTVTLTALTPE